MFDIKYFQNMLEIDTIVTLLIQYFSKSFQVMKSWHVIIVSVFWYC